MDQNIGSTQGSQTPTQSRKDYETPPHLPSRDAAFAVPDLIVTNQLHSVTGPIDKIDLPSNSKIDLSYPEDMPGLYASRHCQQNEAKAGILEALQLGHTYLRHKALLKAVDFSQSDLTKSKVVDILQDLERLMGCVRVTHDASTILGIAPEPKYIEVIPKKLTAAKNEVLNTLLENGMALPSPPVWERKITPKNGRTSTILKSSRPVTDMR